MEIWTLGTDWRGPYNILVVADPKSFPAQNFITEGKKKTWIQKPRLAPFEEKGKKKQKPLGDVSTLFPGSLVLNANAYDQLQSYLTQFGQLLEAVCDGEPYYFYNVTNVVECFDLERCEFNRAGGVTSVVFNPEAVPFGEQIFKEPRRLATDIYVTGAAKNWIEALILSCGITGLDFVRVA